MMFDMYLMKEEKVKNYFTAFIVIFFTRIKQQIIVNVAILVYCVMY